MARITTKNTRMLWIIFFLIILTLQIETHERIYFRHRIFVRRHLCRSASRHARIVECHRWTEGSRAIRWRRPRTRIARPPAKYHPRHRHGLEDCKNRKKSVIRHRFYAWARTFRLTACRNLICKGFRPDLEHPHGGNRPHERAYFGTFRHRRNPY